MPNTSKKEDSKLKKNFGKQPLEKNNMSDPSKRSSAGYKVDRQTYEDNWDRIFNKKEEPTEPKNSQEESQ